MVTKLLLRIIEDEEGTTAMEYGLIGSVIVTAIVASLWLIGPRLSIMFGVVASCFR